MNYFKRIGLYAGEHRVHTARAGPTCASINTHNNNAVTASREACSHRTQCGPGTTFTTDRFISYKQLVTVKLQQEAFIVTGKTHLTWCTHTVMFALITTHSIVMINKVFGRNAEQC